MSEEKKKPHPLQRAWAGGVFDARVQMPHTGYVLRVESTDEAMIRRFAETVGVGKVLESPKKNPARPVFILQTHSMDETRELLLLVAPFLSAVKTKQAADMIARIERHPKWQKNHPEKAALCAISPVQNAEAETTGQNTRQDG